MFRRNFTRTPAFLAGFALATLVLVPFSSFAKQESGGEMGGMQDMMEMMKKWATPGPEHQMLNRFIGEWETETSLMYLGQKMGSSKGSATFEWLLDGRWVQQHSTGSMMGMPIESYSTMGYDKFRKNFVATTVSTMDTAMNRVEGDFTQDGQTLIMYGSIDEYLTGELCKWVKGVYRFQGDDTIIFEIHDLAIGEGDQKTQVIEVKYTRKK